MIRFDAGTRVKLYTALKGAFPDSRPSDADLLALSVCLDRAKAQGDPLPAELQNIDLKPYAAELKTSAAELELSSVETSTQARSPLDKARYYWVESKHARFAPGGFEPFVGQLAMVRVTLPLSRAKTFNTAIGKVFPADHLIDTVLEANQKYARFLEAPLGRVDLITPPRQGVRFGAISILLGYKTPNEPLPYCYILEAGTATGQPKVLYFGKTMDTIINAYSGYQPTPFACPSHAYTGKLTMNGDDPNVLTIRARPIEGGKSAPVYIQIDASFSAQQGDVKTIWPGFLIARAASIVFMRQHRGTISTQCDHAPPRNQLMKKRATLSFLIPLLGAALLGGCNGGVEHPEPGEPSAVEVCAKRPEGEMNCMACSALPGCGWCGSPAPESAQCQPGVSADSPATCQSGWAQSSENCSPPPPEESPPDV